MNIARECVKGILRRIHNKVQQCQNNVNTKAMELDQARAALQVAQEIYNEIEREYTEPESRPSGISGPPLKSEIIIEGGKPKE